MDALIIAVFAVWFRFLVTNDVILHLMRHVAAESILRLAVELQDAKGVVGEDGIQSLDDERLRVVDVQLCQRSYTSFSDRSLPDCSLSPSWLQPL